METGTHTQQASSFLLSKWGVTYRLDRSLYVSHLMWRATASVEWWKDRLRFSTRKKIVFRYRSCLSVLQGKCFVGVVTRVKADNIHFNVNVRLASGEGAKHPSILGKFFFFSLPLLSSTHTLFFFFFFFVVFFFFFSSESSLLSLSRVILALLPFR